MLELRTQLGDGENSDDIEVSEYVITVLSPHSPQGVASDTNQAIGTQLGRERRSVLEGVVNKRREIEAVLVGVVEPRSTRKCKDAGGALNHYADQLCGL